MSELIDLQYRQQQQQQEDLEDEQMIDVQQDMNQYGEQQEEDEQNNNYVEKTDEDQQDIPENQFDNQVPEDQNQNELPLQPINQMSPEDYQKYIYILQEKLQFLESQFAKDNQESQQRGGPDNFDINNINDENLNKNYSSPSKRPKQKCPTYPRAYEDWVLRQSISPSKVQPLKNYFQDQKQCTFKPKINEISNKLPQRQDISDPQKYMVNYLYEDALQRFQKNDHKQKKTNENILLESNKSKMGLKSQKIVLKKIEDTLNTILSEIEESDQLSFQNLGLFMENLGVFKALKFKKTSVNETSLYLQDRQKIDLERLPKEMLFHEQLWNILSGSGEFVQKRVLFDCTLVLLEKKLFVPYSGYLLQQILQHNNVPLPNSQQQQGENGNNTEGQQNTEENNQNQEQEQQQQEKNPEQQQNDQQQDQNQEEKDQQGQQQTWSLEQLIVEFRQMFEDKTQLMQFYANKRNILDSVEINSNEPKFQPTINKKSQIIDKNNNGDKKRYNLLFEHSKYLLEKRIEQKEKIDMEEIEKCTFQPYTNDYNFPEFSDISQNRFEKLYNLNEKKLQKNQDLKHQLEEKRDKEEIKECTFKPKRISHVPQKTLQNKSYVEEVKGSQQVVQRYQKARDDKEFQDGYWERQSARWMEHDTSKTTNFIPFDLSMTSKSIKKDRGELLGIVDVNYQKGRKAKIAIYKEDEPRQLAINFAKIHGLSKEMTGMLEEMLENHIKSCEASFKHELSNQQPQQQEEEEDEEEVEPQEYDQNQQEEVEGGGDEEQEVEQEEEGEVVVEDEQKIE